VLCERRPLRAGRQRHHRRELTDCRWRHRGVSGFNRNSCPLSTGTGVRNRRNAHSDQSGYRRCPVPSPIGSGLACTTISS
jgi:hypothetical protein